MSRTPDHVSVDGRWKPALNLVEDVTIGATSSIPVKMAIWARGHEEDHMAATSLQTARGADFSTQM